VLRKLAGIAEGTEISSRTALECNQDFLNAISFSKGCYLGQELTARSNFTGVVRKRIVPVMIVDTEMEVPKPWVMASMIQELGTEEGMDKIFGLTGEDGEKKKLALKGYIPPPLPKISAAGAGSIVSMMMGSVASADENPQDDRSEELNRLREQGQKLQEEIVDLAEAGASIIDKKDSRTIGKIVSTPAPGTTVLLAQMRLDRLGLLGSEQKWSRKNKVMIGDSEKEYRYLPFLPLWWPDIDPATGKGKEEQEK
jgi:folate-binding protein YgfZ